MAGFAAKKMTAREPRPSADERTEGGDRWAEFEKAFGVRPPPFESEEKAPPVDRGVIYSVVRGEASPAVTRVVERLKWRFKSWADAYFAEHAAEFRRRQGSGGIRNSSDPSDDEASPVRG